MIWFLFGSLKARTSTRTYLSVQRWARVIPLLFIFPRSYLTLLHKLYENSRKYENKSAISQRVDAVRICSPPGGGHY